MLWFDLWPSVWCRNMGVKESDSGSGDVRSAMWLVANGCTVELKDAHRIWKLKRHTKTIRSHQNPFNLMIVSEPNHTNKCNETFSQPLNGLSLSSSVTVALKDKHSYRNAEMLQQRKNWETSTAIERKLTTFVLRLLFIFLLSFSSFFFHSVCLVLTSASLSLSITCCYFNPFMSTCELFAVCDSSLQLTKLKYSHMWKQALSLALPRLCALSYLNVKTLSHTYFFHRCRRSKGKSSVVIESPPPLKPWTENHILRKQSRISLYLCLSIPLSLFCLALLLNLFSFSVYFYPFSYITSHTHSLP